MRNLWTIDPGKRCSYAAIFVGMVLWGVLRSTSTAMVKEALYKAQPTIIVLEKMRVYPTGHKSIKELVAVANDLIEVSESGNEFAGWVRGEAELIRRPASTWKGSVNKVVHHLDLWEKLAPGERDVLARGIGKTTAEVGEKIRTAAYSRAMTGKTTNYSWEGHNFLDAVGIGVDELGR